MNGSDTISLAKLAEVNPKVDLRGLNPDTPVSFVPMSDVTETGRWVNRQERRFDDVRFGYTPFAEGDVLFAKITPCMENGKGAHALGLKNGVGFGSTEFHVLRAKDEHSSRYLFHWLQAQATRTRAIAYMGGSAGQQRVQPDFFTNYRVERIDPDEQSRIAAVLDTVDEAIAKTEAVIAKLRQVRAGLLHDLLTRGLDAHGQLRDYFAHPEQFQDSPLGRIPSEWEPKTLEHAADWFSGGTPSRSQHSYWSGEVPFLTPKDMKVFEVSDSTEHISEEAAKTGSKVMAPETTFIVVRGMILAHTFPVCFSTRPLAFNQDIKAVRAREGLAPRFLAHWFASNAWMFLRKTTEATHGTKKLDLKELHRVYIGVPKPEEQDAIVKRIDEADVAIQLEVKKCAKLGLLKSGLTADLLTGRVCVPENILMDSK